MFGLRGPHRSQLSVAILVLLGGVVVASFVILPSAMDSSLRVVGHEWERTVEVETRSGRDWVLTGTHTNSGTALTDRLQWPRPKLGRTGDCEGCQRVRRRTETYTVRLLDPISKRGHGCALPEAKWRSFAPESRWEGKFDRRTGELVRQVIRHRFLDPDATAEVIAQKLRQSGLPISNRSVERVIAEYGLQKKTLSMPPSP